MKHDRYAKFYCDIEKALRDSSPETVFPDYSPEKFLSESEFLRFDSKEELSNFIVRLVESHINFYNSVYIACARFKGEKLACTCCKADLTEVQK